MDRNIRISRRRLGSLGVGALAAGALGGGSFGVRAALQPPIVSTKTGSVPTTGGMRPGPLGLAPAAVTRNRGARPVGLRFEKFAIDAQVEYLQIVDGIMQNPTGPWIVGWYEATAALGQSGNAVFVGHVDYWDVGPAVFYNITNGEIEPGDEIEAVGEDGSTYRYAVTERDIIEVASLTTDRIGEIVGPTQRESLTLLTCGGEFDYASGEYLSRTYVRAERITE